MAVLLDSEFPPVTAQGRDGLRALAVAAVSRRGRRRPRRLRAQHSATLGPAGSAKPPGFPAINGHLKPQGALETSDDLVFCCVNQWKFMGKTRENPSISNLIGNV